MKRLQHQEHKRASRYSLRRGAVFHYYMMYLFLSSVLLTTAGLSLHLMLKADRLDERASQHLKMLLHLDENLRRDAGLNADTATIECQESQLLYAAPDGSVTQWVVEQNKLTRVVKDGDTLVASNRFVFPKGTTLQFTQSNNDKLVTLTLTEPSIVGERNTSSSPDSATHAIEIVFAVVRPEVPSTVSVENSSADKPGGQAANAADDKRPEAATETDAEAS